SREMLEDLRNYRSIAGASSPQATAVLSSYGAPTSTLPLNAALSGRGAIVEDPAIAATVHSLSSKATLPTQTPIIRRTGAIAPVPEPPKKKSSVLASIFLGLVLVGVIAYGAYKLRPVWQDAQQLRQEQKKTEAAQSAASKAGAEPVNKPEEEAGGSESSASEAAPEPKKPEPSLARIEAKRSE